MSLRVKKNESRRLGNRDFLGIGPDGFRRLVEQEDAPVSPRFLQSAHGGNGDRSVESKVGIHLDERGAVAAAKKALDVLDSL